MFCPKCRSEFVAAVTWCQSCEVGLVEELPAVDAFGSAEGMAALLAERELAVLMTGSHVELQKVQRLFAEQRIATVIAGDPEQEPSEAAMHPRFFLMVAEDEAARAMAAFRTDWKEGMAVEGLGDAAVLPESIETCPACGVAVPAHVAECPECGLFLGEGEDVG